MKMKFNKLNKIMKMKFNKLNKIKMKIKITKKIIYNNFKNK